MIDALRDEIADVDARLVHLAARRIDLARRIAAAKRAADRPVHDGGQEQVVLERAQALAKDAGLDPGLATDLMRRLIDAAVQAQEDA